MREVRVDRGATPGEAANATARAAEVEAELEGRVPAPVDSAPVDDWEIFQESPRLKAIWLAEARQRIPIGTRVKVVRSITPEYVGVTGVVVEYDVGSKGEWPMVDVAFDEPTPVRSGRFADDIERDSFYYDGHDPEIVPLPRELHRVVR